MKANFAQKSRLTDKKRIPLADLLISANTTHIKAIIDVIDNAIIKRGFLYPFHPQKDKEKSIIRSSMCILMEHIIINQ